MTPGRKPPSGPPPSAGVLAKYARAYSRQLGVGEGRVRAWISYMIMAGMLERTAAEAGGYRFTVKGGVALELRLRDRARATKDIDVVLHDADTDLARALERTLTTDSYQGFAFRRKDEPLLLDNAPSVWSSESRIEEASGQVSQSTFVTVDVARAEPGESEVELVPAILLTEAFGVTGPADLPCIPLRLHIAQKLHGMTLPPRSGKRNERFRDLVDLLLMEELITDYAGLREACGAVFRGRATHHWPPLLEVPPHWSEPFAHLARDLDLPVIDAHAAMVHVQAFVDHILASG